ncbi:MAG: TerB family tellurite resistance protein [Micavibrio aeruginosavorus]|uniref:TerB family tellurite resistance protein n=1 Tax=Micavibrio aeruginosavorus TaxID=349221 RepID=A0A7T5R488_9BACT|nr:MAG: TerB family tellurite resistance protein [Micavibrio aeruginosavorus]
MTSMADSRFYMWRTVFALAHADGQVTDKERQFMQIYLSRLSLSPEQKDILKADIDNRQEVSLMFSKITAEKDVEDFFNFARLLVWCDGDFAEQERQILELLRQRHDTPLGTERLIYKLKASGEKKSSWLRKMREKAGELKDILDVFAASAIADDAKGKKGEGLGHSRFYMWRAVFAMAHADNVVTEEERKYLRNILAEEPFSAEQKKILEEDMAQPQDIAEMFVNIEDQNDRSQFFYHARMLVWSDGDFGEQEQKIMMRLKQTHVRTVDFDQIMKNLDLSIDDEQKQKLAESRSRVLDVDPPQGFFRRLLRSVSGR